MILLGLFAVVGLVLGRLGYLVSMWNSPSILSVRRRFAGAGPNQP